MPLTTSQAPSGASPLWIIALFIALSEVTAGVAAITTDGATRLIFAIFAVVFPVAVFVTFIWLLITYAPNLYSPNQYTEAITPESYAGALNRRSKAEARVYRKAATEVVTAAGGPDSKEAQRLIEHQIEQVVRSRSVEVDIRAIVPHGGSVLLPVDEETTAADLLDDIYFSMAPHVEPFQYTKTWSLQKESGAVLREIGSTWARGRGQDRDLRTLAEVGIAPGDRLRVIRNKSLVR